MSTESTRRSGPGAVSGAAAPWLVLVLAGLSLFLFQDDRAGFQRGHHGFLSSHGLALARNLSLENHLLMFNTMSIDESGQVTYDVYNGFPIGAFAAVRLFTLPFEGDLSMQIHVARNLMLLFLFAAIGLGFDAVRRLTGNPGIATVATLWAFSSYYAHFYGDMVFNDIPALFGMCLVFQGLALFKQEGGLIRLALKVMVAIFFGWQALALVVPFVLWELAGNVRRGASLRTALASPAVRIGIVALLFTALVVAGNLWNEAMATGKSLTDLPTVQRVLWRLGLADDFAYEGVEHQLAWSRFFADQFYRLGRIALPDAILRSSGPRFVYQVTGAAALCLAGVAVATWPKATRSVAGALVLAGIVWAVPMRHFVAFHDFQALYYTGIPLIACAGLLRLVQPRAERWLLPAGVAAAGVFVLSSLHVNVNRAFGADHTSNLITREFQRITEEIGSKQRVFVDGDARAIGGSYWSLAFYLAGDYIQTDPETADYLLALRPAGGGALAPPQIIRGDVSWTLVTSGHERALLYRRASLP